MANVASVDSNGNDVYTCVVAAMTVTPTYSNVLKRRKLRTEATAWWWRGTQRAWA